MAKLNDERGNSFHAGKSFDSASASSRELGDLEGVLSYADQGMFPSECFQVILFKSHRTDRFWKLNKAATLFIKGDVPDTAFNTLVRAAKHVEKEKPDAAVQFYQKEK